MPIPEARQSDARKKRVLIVDDHPIARYGLAKLIEQEADLEVCGEAEDFAQALKALASARPDVVVADISLPGKNGLDLVKDIKARHAGLPVLVLSIHDESLYAERALRAGASGYIMKEEAAEEVVAAIRRVLAGEVYLSQPMASRMLSRLVRGQDAAASPAELLTDRELQVFELMGQGMGTRQVAERLHLSVKTIETHQAHIKEKLNLSTVTQLVRHAVLWVQRAGVRRTEEAGRP